MSHFDNKYYNPRSRSCYGSVNRVKQSLPKSSRKNIKSYLESQDVYTKHKFTRQKFVRRKVMAPYKNYLWQADLIDMKKFSRSNKGYKWILCVIDVLSKFAYAKCLYNKTGTEVARAFKEILSIQNKPKQLQVDEGREFFNATVKNLLKEYDIVLFHTYSKFKACVVERFNSTLLSRIYKHFTHTGEKKYYDIIDNLLFSYNNCIHRSIQMKPASVNKYNQMDAWMTLYKDLHGKTWNCKPKFKINDTVRILKRKEIFEKGYTTRFSDDIYLIDSIVPGYPIMYRIKDFLNNVHSGMYYAEELSKVNDTENRF